ncbi:hypothetical protein [Methylotenera sp.]|uniref:hypothetical protein n=1 Tax=Methylotenera sp. TaxID=2051956 RepID=UPI002EDBA2FB
MKFIIPILFLFFSTLANAVTADPDSVIGIIKSSMLPSIGIITAMAIKTLSGFVLLQFILTNIGLLKSGSDLEQVWAKLLGSLFWFGICFYVISNGPEFIKGVGNQFFDLLGIGLPDPSIIIASTLAMAVPLSVLGVIVGVASTVGGQAILGVALFIFGTGLFFAIKIFMIQLELALVVMLSPLSFSMLGLNALKDQGIAPFKALISLIYRIILMTIILAAFTQVSTVMADLLNQAMAEATSLKGLVGSVVPGMENPFSKMFGMLFSGLGAFALLAYMLYKSDSIASSLASGSTSMGPADMAAGVAAGVAAGMAAHSSGAATLGASNQGASAVSDMVKGLRSQAASVTNASGSGTGGYGSGPGSNSMFSLGDAPKGGAKSPNYSTKDIQQMAKDKGLPPVGGVQQPSSNSTSSAGSKAASSSSGVDSSPGNNSNSSSPNQAGSPSMSSTNTSSPANENIQSAPLGNANNASISGAGSSALENQLGALVEQLSKQGQSKPSAKDRLSSLNNQIERESSATNVSISTLNHD